MAENPMAGVSGPGPYAKRTDIGTPEMKMGSIAYGEGVETQAIKSGAPLGKTADAVAEPQDRLRPAPAGPVTELFAETQRKDEPVTAGIDMGAGPGSSALMMQSKFAERKLSDILAEMIPFDNTGEVAILYQNALARGN
jgi:hypothetical protein